MEVCKHECLQLFLQCCKDAQCRDCVLALAKEAMFKHAVGYSGETAQRVAAIPAAASQV